MVLVLHLVIVFITDYSLNISWLKSEAFCLVHVRKYPPHFLRGQTDVFKLLVRFDQIIIQFRII